MYAGRVVCCPLVSHVSMPTGQTDGETSDRYITLSARRDIVIIFALLLALVLAHLS